MQTVEINSVKIGYKNPIYIVAEIGINHNGDVELAWETMRAAHESGVDAVKLQTFTTSRFVHPDNKNYDFLRSIELSQKDFEELFSRARDYGMTVFATPESLYDLEFLSSSRVPAIKIASMDLNYELLIRNAAKLQKPIIVSTGMGFLHEVVNAVNWIEEEGNEAIILLHCTSLYPTSPAQANLAVIKRFNMIFDYPVGYSDHTIGVDVACAAAGLGACMLEKHFTLDKSMPGPDHAGSANANDMKKIISWIRTMEMAVGNNKKGPVDKEKEARLLKRRAIYAARDMKKGACLRYEDVALLTPSTPMSQLEDLDRFIGRPLKKGVMKGDLITVDVFS